MKKNKIQKVYGFTLAEVLITLGIIGVVAALTIPALINSTQDQEFKSGLKEANTILSQALVQLKTDNGGTIVGICATNDSKCFKNAIKPYLKYVKECDNTVMASGCWVANTSMDGTPVGMNGAPDSGLVLTNGMMVSFQWTLSSCTYTDANSSNWGCGRLNVDVNGAKGPNKFSKDAFVFSFQDGTMKPLGIPGDKYEFGTCTGTETGAYAGWGCTYKYLTQ